MLLDTTRCVILNSAYEPLNVKSARRGLLLYIKGKAKILEELDNGHVSNVDDMWPIPTQVVLHTYVKARSTFRTPALLNNNNIFIRDKYICQYCNRHKSELSSGEIFTRDHVVPRDAGGRDTWENVVTACNTCNNKKGNKMLEDTAFSLKKKPYTPTVFEILSKADTKHRKI